MIVLHAVGGTDNLLFWAESSAQPTSSRTGGKGFKTSPLAASREELSQAFARIDVAEQKLQFSVATILLPTKNGRPVASSTLIDENAANGAAELDKWQITAAQLPSSECAEII